MNTVQPLPIAKKEAKWWGIISALLFFLLYEGISTVMAWGLSLYVSMIYPDKAAQLAAFNEYSNLLMVLVDVIVVLSLSVIVLAAGKPYFREMGMKKTRPETLPVAFLSGIGLSCALSFVMGLVEMIFPKVMEDYNQTMEMSYNMGQIVLYILAGVIGAPLVEELIFRHCMAGNLTKGAPRWLSILLTSAVFGLVHGHILQIIYAGLLGILMACLYFAYDSVLPSIALHAGFNSVSLLSLIDTSDWSKLAQARFDMIISIAVYALVLVGLGGTVWLFIRKTHWVWKNSAMEEVQQVVYEPVARPMTVEWDSLLSAERAQGSFPSVADLSANMKGKAEANTETSVQESPASAEEVGE